MIGKNTIKVLDTFQKATVNKARQNLGTRRIGRNKSYGGTRRRSLQKSLYSNLELGTGNITFGSTASYAPFIYYGVSGTRKKRKDTPFSYKDKMPPVDAILKWMKVKPVRIRDKDGKFVKATESKRRGVAYVLAKRIQKRGIAGIPFFLEAFEMIYPKFESKIADALALDMLEAIVEEGESNNLKEE